MIKLTLIQFEQQRELNLYLESKTSLNISVALQLKEIVVVAVIALAKQTRLNDQKELDGKSEP